MVAQGMPQDSVAAAMRWRSASVRLTVRQSTAVVAAIQDEDNSDDADEIASDVDWSDAFATACWFAARDLDRYVPLLYAMWVNGPADATKLDGCPPAVNSATGACGLRPQGSKALPMSARLPSQIQQQMKRGGLASATRLIPALATVTALGATNGSISFLNLEFVGCNPGSRHSHHWDHAHVLSVGRRRSRQP